MARVAASAYRHLQVSSGQNWFYFWTFDESEYDWWSEGYQEYNPNTNLHSYFYEEDYYYYDVDEVYRAIHVDSGSPSAPATAGDVYEQGPGDGDWMEVEFLVDAPAS